VISYVLRFLAIATGSAQAGLTRISTHIDDVARTLGTKPFGIARAIHLPLARRRSRARRCLCSWIA
jgi:iron(III) transport system permease protein